METTRQKVKGYVDVVMKTRFANLERDITSVFFRCRGETAEEIIDKMTNCINDQLKNSSDIETYILKGFSEQELQTIKMFVRSFKL